MPGVLASLGILEPAPHRYWGATVGGFLLSLIPGNLHSFSVHELTCLQFHTVARSFTPRPHTLATSLPLRSLGNAEWAPPVFCSTRGICAVLGATCLCLLLPMEGVGHLPDPGVQTPGSPTGPWVWSCRVLYWGRGLCIPGAGAVWSVRAQVPDWLQDLTGATLN